MLKLKPMLFCLLSFILIFTNQIFFGQNQLDKSIDQSTTESEIFLLKQSLKNSLKDQTIERTIGIYNSLIGLYEADKKYDKAVYYQDKLIRINDSLNNIEKGKVLAEFQAQLESVKHDKDIAIANAKNVSQLRKLEQQKLQQYIYYFGGFSVLFIVIGLLSRLRYMRRKRAELIAKSKRIEIEKNRAEESEKIKEQFLGRMSHEIRSPMNAIMGMTNILQKNKHYKQQGIYLDAIWKSSENLLVILNDIIDLSKLETGKIKIVKIPFKPIDELMKLRELLKYKADEKGLELLCKLDEKIPETLIGDPIRLNQILVNLVGNAIKFTDKGKVQVSIQLKEIRNSTAVIEAHIIDTGIGIAKAQIDEIFESFIQADSDTEKKYAGTGLGLTISKELVQLQGGQINVSSEFGIGSKFTFEIPFEMGVKEVPVIQKKLISNDLKGLRVLLVEDNEFNSMVAIDELNDIIDDVKIDLVSNGKQALEKVIKNNYDIVLMDIEMEEMNGYEAARAIRNLESNKKNTAIIAITASALKSDIEKCFEAGMNNHIAKPFTSSELKMKIESLFNKQTSS